MSINLGILGLAHGHVSVYIDQWLKMAGRPVNVVGAWDHERQRLAAGCERFKIDRCDTPEALLRTPGLDAVVIGAETSLHADLVEAAAAAGKAIILQKPLCLTLEQADRIVDAVARTGVPFTVATMMSLNWRAASTRPSVRRSTSHFPCSREPPGVSTFSF